MKTKQLIYTVLLLLFSVNLISAQEKIVVPEIAETQKVHTLNWQLNHTVMIGFKYAKTQGVTAEEYAEYFGNISKNVWDKKNGFNGFKKSVIWDWELWRAPNSPKIQIVKQTDNMLQFKTPCGLKGIAENNAFMGVSYEELMTIYRVMFETVAADFGASYQQKLIENGNWLEVTVTK